MFYNWKTNRKRARFCKLTAAILDTRPMPIQPASWSIISMVANSDVQMYILAVKSLYLRLKRGKVIALVARDMPMAARKTLEHHLPGIQFAIQEDIDTGACQHGGCWERLLYLVNHARDEYAIQLDADTLAFGTDIDEVVNCVENNIPFTLGNAGRPIGPMSAIAADARAMPSDHVTIDAERLFDQYPQSDALKYVRASAAFAGFARGGIRKEAIENFHREMQSLMGKRWFEWGTEQCASNFAVANSPGAIVLPFPKYANFGPHLERGKNSFLHFFGTHRFQDDYYATCARGVIGELNS